MGRLRRLVPVAYPACLLVLSAAQVLAPQEDGPLAVAQVFAPWLFLPLLALLPHAALLRDRALAGTLAGCALVFAVHVAPDHVPSGRSEPDGAATRLTVTSWNVLVSNAPADVAAGVRSARTDRTWRGSDHCMLAAELAVSSP